MKTKNRVIIILAVILVGILSFNNFSMASDVSMDSIFSQGDSFLSAGGSGQTLDDSVMKGATDIIYNILFTLYLALAIIIGVFLGIKYMLAATSDKAEIKQSLITYVVAIVILFGAFGIWKIVVQLFS